MGNSDPSLESGAEPMASPMNDPECGRDEKTGFCAFDCEADLESRRSQNDGGTPVTDCTAIRRKSSLSLTISTAGKVNKPGESPVLRGCLCAMALAGSSNDLNDTDFEAIFDFKIGHLVVGSVDFGMLDKQRMLLFTRGGDGKDVQNTLIDFHGGLSDVKGMRLAGKVNLPNAKKQGFLYVSFSSDYQGSCATGNVNCRDQMNWTLRHLRIGDNVLPSPTRKVIE